MDKLADDNIYVNCYSKKEIFKYQQSFRLKYKLHLYKNPIHPKSRVYYKDFYNFRLIKSRISVCNSRLQKAPSCGAFSTRIISASYPLSIRALYIFSL